MFNTVEGMRMRVSSAQPFRVPIRQRQPVGRPGGSRWVSQTEVPGNVEVSFLASGMARGQLGEWFAIIKKEASSGPERHRQV